MRWLPRRGAVFYPVQAYTQLWKSILRIDLCQTVIESHSCYDAGVSVSKRWHQEAWFGGSTLLRVVVVLLAVIWVPRGTKAAGGWSCFDDVPGRFDGVEHPELSLCPTVWLSGEARVLTQTAPGRTVNSLDSSPD